MTFKKGQWTYNYCNVDVWRNGEYFDTKEQAIEAGKLEYKDTVDRFVVGQIEPAVIGTSIDVDWVFDNIGESAYDEVGEVAEDYLRDVKAEHSKILQERMDEVIHNWMVEFDYFPKFFHIVNVDVIEND